MAPYENAVLPSSCTAFRVSETNGAPKLRPRDLTGAENALDDMSAGAGYHSTLHLHSLRTADLYNERSNLC